MPAFTRELSVVADRGRVQEPGTGPAAQDRHDTIRPVADRFGGDGSISYDLTQNCAELQAERESAQNCSGKIGHANLSDRHRHLERSNVKARSPTLYRVCTTGDRGTDKSGGLMILSVQGQTRRALTLFCQKCSETRCDINRLQARSRRQGLAPLDVLGELTGPAPRERSATPYL